MNNENKIDNYFDRVKQNPPLIPIEKVHQIINSPGAVARLKGKPRNLLKFTIMTTIFAVIISAVLLWPGEDPKLQVSDSKFQVSDSKFQVSDSKVSDSKFQVDSNFQVAPVAQDSGRFETDYADSGKMNTSSDDKTTVIAYLNKTTTYAKASNYQAANNEQLAANNQEKSIEPVQQNKQKSLDFDPTNIQTSDGSRFILKLSNEELAKIGIRIVDKSIVYKNIANGYCYEYGARLYKAFVQEAPEKYIFFKDEKGRKYSEHYKGIRFSRKNWKKNVKPVRKKNIKPKVIKGSTENYSYYYEITDDTIAPTQFDFYPVFKSNEYFGEIQGNGSLKRSDFEMANDTLVPIVFPKMGGGDTENILWFVLTNQLYDILSVNYKPLMDELIQYKTVKKRFPQKNIIDYRSPFSIDEYRILKLSKNELQKMGFSFYADSTIYSGINFKVMLSNKQITTLAKGFDKQQILDINDGCLALFVTDNSGNTLNKSLGLLPMLFPNKDEIYRQIPLLIPVEVKGGGFYNSLFFWFLPTESFFKAISKEISTEIKAEYDYVIAEDKSQLEKPDCKYFDECKNTLKVSNFKAYPNPASNRLSVSFTLPEPIDGRITLVDLAGRERQMLHPQTQFVAGPHNFEFDLSSVSEGIYLLTLYSNKGVQTQRLMVAR